MISTALLTELDNAQAQQLLTYNQIGKLTDRIHIMFPNGRVPLERIAQVQQYIQTIYNYETCVSDYDVGLVVYDIPFK